MRNNKIIKNLFKILAFSIVIIFFYRIWIFVINANLNSNYENKNNTNFKNILSSDISKTWVAITTNIWIKFNNNINNKIDQTIFEEYFSVEEIKNNPKKIQENLISKNMLNIKEYFSIIKTDFKSSIKNSSNRKTTLESIYWQLRIRYNNWIQSAKYLEKQRDLLVKEAEDINLKVEQLKKKISLDYKKVDVNATNENIDNYLKLKKEYTIIRTYVIFINNFIKQYTALNNYNINLINTFSLNKDAIIKWSYVVIPNNWNDILKDYWLLYTEKEFEEIKKKEEKTNEK